ncbi:MAG: DUF4595 domain-containing protein [Duncaniella sp.]|uniref:DUF4595 domain-containing protein n=1 Tax=Duncaniella sp. TaxID=2518496 RepID=UPI0023C4C49E|nr:DUF4595 domain-containing protein [Duncaniella sp.]MDE5988147.1 DUF4595 domain-containing protein [Duncaniella sp.]
MNAIAMMAIASYVGFVSCSDDGKDEPNGGENGEAVAVNPSKVFTAGVPKQIGAMSITTDANGLVTSMMNAEDGTKIALVYPGMSRAESYDVVMTIEEDGDKNVFNLRLNDLGFAKYCKQIESDGDVEEWWFEYNSDGRLTKMTRSEGDNEVHEITYENGNITKVKEIHTDHDGDDDWVISYGTQLIENKGCIMLFDETFGIDMDELKYAYFAGLLGKATKNLPIERSDKTDGDKGTYTWTLNPDGMPIKLVAVESGDDWEDEPQTMKFKW